MSSHSYALESHVVFPETNAPHPTREQLLAEQEAADKRRRRAAKARHITQRRSRE